MKYLLFVFSLISISAIAQVDSSQYYLPVQMKTKFAVLLVPEKSGIEDTKYILSLDTAVNNGSKPDSVTTINLKVGTYWNYINSVFFEIEVADYDFALEFFDAALTANGYSGLFKMLEHYKANGTANQKIAANWLYNKAYPRYLTKKNVLVQDQVRGFQRLQKAKNPTYN